jgi:hypothetical protein
MRGDTRSVDWLRLIRLLTQYIAPGLVAVVMLGELLGASLTGPSLSGSTGVYNCLLLAAFTVLTVTMIAICGWTVFLWDIDRLFFTLENKIDAQIGELDTKSPDPEQDGSLLGRAREMLNNAVQTVRVKSVALIEKAYWDDINAGGVLAFPQPDIAAAIEQIDKSRRDLLAPLTELVASAIPLGNLPASIVSRLIFRYVAPQVKVRLYRRLVLRFLSQLGALFALTAVCFYISILAWSRVNGSIFAEASIAPVGVLLYQLDLMLRGALFDFMEHTHRSVSPIAINQTATAFVYYTLFPHVRRRLRHLLRVQGHALRLPPLAAAAETVGCACGWARCRLAIRVRGLLRCMSPQVALNRKSLIGRRISVVWGTSAVTPVRG